MTWHKELVNIRHTRGLPPEGSSVEYVWRCWQLDVNGKHVKWDPFSSADHVVLATSLALPQPGETVSSVITSLANTWADYFRWRQVTWNMIGDSMCVWEATALASSRDVWCPDPNVTRTDEITTRKAGIYRNSAPTSADYVGGTAVSGTRVDYGGRVLLHETIPQIRIQVQFIWNTADQQGLGYPNVAGWSSYLNKRNSTTFLLFPAGTVVFDAVQIDPEQDEYVRVTWQFTWDAWAHLSQVAKNGPDGQPITEVVSGDIHAKEVEWEQPYEGTADHTEMFSAYEFNYLLNGWGYRTEARAEGCSDVDNLVGTNASLPLAAQLDVTAGIRDSPEPPS